MHVGYVIAAEQRLRISGDILQCRHLSRSVDNPVVPAITTHDESVCPLGIHPYRMTLAERSSKVIGWTFSSFCATGWKPSFWYSGRAAG